MPSKWTDVISSLILCCSKCKYHSKCGKTLCDCEIEPQLTPQISPQPSPKASGRKAPARKRKMLPLTPISV